MKNISNRDTYISAVEDFAREWENQVVLTDGVHTETYASCDIKISSAFSQDSLSMGHSFTKELNLKIYEPERTLIYNLASIKVYARLKVGEDFVSVPMGEYFPNEVTTQDDYETLEITAYDFMGKLDVPYVPDYANVYNFSCDTKFYYVDNGELQYLMAGRSLPAIRQGGDLTFVNNSDLTAWVCAKVNGEWVGPAMGDQTINRILPDETFTISCEEYIVSFGDYYTGGITCNGVELAPMTMLGVIRDIGKQYGFTTAGAFPYPEIDTIYEGTCAEVLGWFAGTEGKNAIFNDNGHLVFRWYSHISQYGKKWEDYPIAWQDMEGTWNDFPSTYPIGRTLQKESGTKLNEGNFTISSITSGTEENVITVGEGKGISFENPYMTITELTKIGNRELGKHTVVGEVNTFGNPLLEVGDIVAVVDKAQNTHEFFISKMEWDLTGGCACLVTAIGDADAEIEFSTVSPTEKKLTKIKNSLQNVVARFSNLINSMVGYYTITEENGVPTGWTIKDNIENPVNMIKCSLGGIGISSNGGETYKTAITGEGIVADSITSGTINAIDITGCTISAESEITFKYTDYSSADLDRIREIILGNVNPTVDDFRKLDVDGNGLISTTDYITVSTMITNHTDETLDTSIVLGDAESGYGLSTNGVFIRSDGILMKGGLTAFKGANFDGNVRPIKDNYWTCGASDHRWTTVYATNGTIQTSDIREKKNIETLDDKYAEFFDTLKPVSYEWRKGDTKRHIGFIAQEVEQGLEKSGIDNFGGLVKDEQYSLNYSEFIPILVAEIQRLKARIDELEKR